MGGGSIPRYPPLSAKACLLIVVPGEGAARAVFLTSFFTPIPRHQRKGFVSREATSRGSCFRDVRELLSLPLDRLSLLVALLLLERMPS
jgi:hypothetical protein